MAMSSYEQSVHKLYDDRISTLARIKTRSVDADVLTLTALRVLVYAQLEGGIKEQIAVVIRQINAYKLQLGNTSPALLKWRNKDDLSRFKAAVSFDNISLAFPFGNLPTRRTKVKPLNRVREFNQMNSQSLAEIYSGLKLNSSMISQSVSAVNDLVEARNDAAHHGIMPKTAKKWLETQVRGDAAIVEMILTDIALQMLTFFANGLHLR